MARGINIAFPFYFLPATKDRSACPGDALGALFFLFIFVLWLNLLFAVSVIDWSRRRNGLEVMVLI